jgi:YkoY family integral membrane protein
VPFHPSDLLTVLLLVALEGLLSADNAMVLAVLVLGLPKSDQRKALRYGIAGAFAFRTLATVFAIHMIRMSAVKLLGGLYLLWLPYRHFFGGRDAQHRRDIPKAKPWLGLNALWATVVKVELTDIVFAFDSILAAVGLSSQLWVVLSGGILGIIMMRLVIGQLLVIVQRYPLLVDGAFVIITWVGIKLVIDFLHSIEFIAFEIPKWASLGLVVVIFGISLLLARLEEARRRSDVAAPGDEVVEILTDRRAVTAEGEDRRGGSGPARGGE